MDGLRGIAMLFVFIGHFDSLWVGGIHANNSVGCFLRLVYADGTFGSSFFMLLSAFFAYGSRMNGRKPFREFLEGRFWRLYPLYLALMLVYLIGCVTIPKLSKLPPDPLHVALFIAGNLLVLPGILPIKPLMDVTWTLSFIIFFYFVEAGLARVFRAAGVSRFGRITFLTTAGILWARSSSIFGWWEARTAIFWCGMALWEVVDAMSGQRRQWAVRLTAPAAVITLLGIWCRTHVMLSEPQGGYAAVAFWVTLITSVTLSAFLWVANFGPGWWKQLLAAPLLRQLGAASYSFYLTHAFAVKAFRLIVMPRLAGAAMTPWVFWACQIGGLALSIGVALTVFSLVEDPFSRLRRTDGSILFDANRVRRGSNQAAFSPS
jgi:peptidoglycan/LPS O-acetylase OafA/YrhL